MAAAIGAGLPVHEPTGNMVVDIGGGTTEVAVISLGGIVTAQSIRVGGDELDNAIIQYVKKEYSLHARRAHRRGDQDGDRLGVPDARRAARRDPRPRPRSPACRRRSWSAREEIRKALEEPVNAIVDAVKTTLDKCPPELSGDIMDRGIVLTGGGALLKGLDERLRHETGMPIHIADRPLDSVALGSGKCVEEFEALQQVLDLRAAPLTAGSTPRGLRTPLDQPAAPARPTGHGDQMRDNRRTRVVLALLLLTAFTLITLDIRGGSGSGLRGLGQRVFGPVERAAAAVVRPVSDFFDGLTNISSNAGEDRRAAPRENQRLQQLVDSTDSDRRRVEELDQLLRVAGLGQYRTVPAQRRRVRRGPGLRVDRDRRRGHAATACKPEMTVHQRSGTGRAGDQRRAVELPPCSC